MKTKQIDFSYPTSTNATNMGFGKTGCWTISVANGNQVAKAVAGFETQSEAIQAALAMPEPFGKLWEKYAV